MTRSHRAPIAWLVVLLLAATARISAAQDHSAEAEQRFRDGKKLMTAKRFEEACAAFETSNRLDPQVATLANLADCREKNAELQSAWTAFLEVERQTRGDAKLAALHKTAKERATRLEERLSYLTVSVVRDSDVEGLMLTRNGEPFDEGLWNSAIPVNGGSYVIGGRAPGRQEWSTTVTVPAEGGRISVDVPRFKEVETLVAPAPEVEEPEPPEELETAGPPMLTGRRKAALGVGAAGLLAIAGGVVLGVQASGLAQDAAALCPTVTGCARADDADALVEQARGRALFANLSYGIGGVAIIAAAVLWFTGAPEHASTRTAVAPVVTPTSVRLDVTVRF